MARPRKVQPTTEAATLPEGSEKMNALALRIWEGQSVSLPLIERVARIKKGLEGQGYTDHSGLVLPDAGFRKYM